MKIWKCLKYLKKDSSKQKDIQTTYQVTERQKKKREEEGEEEEEEIRNVWCTSFNQSSCLDDDGDDD